MRRTALLLAILGVLILAVVTVSWTVFPAWRQTPGGFWILLVTAATGVISFVGGALDVLEKIQKLGEKAKALPVPPSFLHQLPPDLPDFTGREKEIEDLLALLSQGGEGAHVAIIVGMGGVGKSALTVHVAHSLTDRYPNAQIVVELRGTSQQPLPPTEAMGQVIHAFHPEMSLPDEPVQVAALYRSTLADRQALILLDDAASAAQVAPLLPPSSCGMIITSRRAIVLPGTCCLNLDALTIDEACDLLQAIVGRDRITPAEAEAIAELCGRLPLALRVAGNFLKVHLDWSAAEYAQALADERKRLVLLQQEDLNVGATLGLSVAQLAQERPDLAARWRMLSIFPASFDRVAAAAVWEVDETETHNGLSILTTRCLVLYIEERGRYWLHDLMRAFARERAAESEESIKVQQAARLRAARWYAEESRAREKRLQPEACHQEAEALATQTGQSLEEMVYTLTMQALAWFETERANLVQAIEWAYQAKEWKLVQQLAGNLVSFFNIRGYWADWEQSHRSALEAARKAHDRRGEAMIYNLLGNAYRLQGRWDKASDMLKEGLCIHQELGDLYGESMARNLLANVYRLQGRWDEAINMFERSLDISQKENNPRGEAIALGGLGNVYRMQGRWAEALDIYEESLDISRAIQNSYGEGITLNNMGLVYCREGRYDKATSVLEESLRIAGELKSPRGKSIALRVQGEVCAQQGRYDEAIDKLEESLDIACSLGDLRVQSQSLNSLGKVHTQQGLWDEADQKFERALSILRKLRDRHGEGLTLRNMGILRKRQGQREEAVAIWQDALAKLHPDSPEYKDVNKWLHEETSCR